MLFFYEAIKTKLKNKNKKKKGIINKNFFYYLKQRIKKICENDTPYNHFRFRKRKAPYITSKRGSITVEAAIIMPLFMFALTTIIQIMSVMNVQLSVQHSLYEQSLKIAGYTYFTDTLTDKLTKWLNVSDYKRAVSIVENGVTEGIVKSMVIDDLGEDFFEKEWIAGGKSGITVIVSPYIESGEIDIIFHYKINLKYNFFGIKEIPIVARARLRKWIGTSRVKAVKESPDENNTEETDKEYVYITSSGACYHLYKDCSYISVALTGVSYKAVGEKRNASMDNYTKCSYCCGQLNEKTIVYITRYGERFHQSKKCSKIYHEVKKVSRAEAGSRRLCSKCKDKSEKK